MAQPQNNPHLPDEVTASTSRPSESQKIRTLLASKAVDVPKAYFRDECYRSTQIIPKPAKSIESSETKPRTHTHPPYRARKIDIARQRRRDQEPESNVNYKDSKLPLARLKDAVSPSAKRFTSRANPEKPCTLDKKHYLCPVDGCDHGAVGSGFSDAYELWVHKLKNHRLNSFKQRENKSSYVKRNEAANYNSDNANGIKLPVLNALDEKYPMPPSRRIAELERTHLPPDTSPSPDIQHYVHDRDRIIRLHGSRNNSLHTTCSEEDETDWDGVSSVDDDFQTNTPTNLGNETRHSLLYLGLSQAQRCMVDRLMTEFWIVFNQQWQTKTRQCGSSQSGSSSESQASVSVASEVSKITSNPLKSSRRDDGGDSEREDAHPAKRKGNTLNASDSNVLPLRFACPYRKRNPSRYCIQTWRSCALTPHTTVARVKAHLYAYHSIHQCQRCKAVFDSDIDLDCHIESVEQCDFQALQVVEGVSNKIRAKLQSRKKAHPRQTEAERWIQIYETLFQPDSSEIIPSPYFEPIMDALESSETVPLRRDFTDYEAFLRHELPKSFNAVLERVVGTEISPIEHKLGQRLKDMIQEAQDRTFATWRALQSSQPSMTLLKDAIEAGYPITNPSLNTSAVPCISGIFSGIAMEKPRGTTSPEHSFATNDTGFDPIFTFEAFSGTLSVDEQHPYASQLREVDWPVDSDSVAMGLYPNFQQANNITSVRSNYHRSGSNSIGSLTTSARTIKSSSVRVRSKRSHHKASAPAYGLFEKSNIIAKKENHQSATPTDCDQARATVCGSEATDDMFRLVNISP